MYTYVCVCLYTRIHYLHSLSTCMYVYVCIIHVLHIYMRVIDMLIFLYSNMLIYLYISPGIPLICISFLPVPPGPSLHRKWLYRYHCEEESHYDHLQSSTLWVEEDRLLHQTRLFMECMYASAPQLYIINIIIM